MTLHDLFFLFRSKHVVLPSEKLKICREICEGNYLSELIYSYFFLGFDD